MKKSRRKFSSTFKTKVVLEALKERSTIQELASKYEVHSTQINSWKREFLENASSTFEVKGKKEDHDLDKAELYSKIGQLQVRMIF